MGYATYHRDNPGPTGVLEHFDLLALVCLSIGPSITDPEAMFEGLVGDRFHRLGKSLFIASSYLAEFHKPLA